LSSAANFGFSLGINDVIPGPKLTEKKDSLIEKAYADCLDLIVQAKKGKLENKPGCDQEQTLEAMISSVLSKVREAVGNICMQELSRHNAPLIMATCGSKGGLHSNTRQENSRKNSLGSVINVSQMVACVGQQIIAGRRVPDGFQDRSLPHFPKKSKEPPSKGFVRNSFYSGLSATEFLFHAISGREGLVDTAVKTAETGYMQRRLMKALEDLTTHYDLSVRNSAGGLVQFCYGKDGLDPACLEGDGQPTDFQRTWSLALVSRIDEYVLQRRLSYLKSKATGSRLGNSLLPFEIIEIANRELKKKTFCSESAAEYLASIRSFVTHHIAHRLAGVRRSRGMFDALELNSEMDTFTDLSMDASGKLDSHRVAQLTPLLLDADKAIVENTSKITEDQLRTFLDLAWVKYIKAQIEPGNYLRLDALFIHIWHSGSTVGAVGAQSIGEPGTQMTLKTFHFAGVASMNGTLGVPRIKEIINAAKTISTPIISCKLVTCDSEPSARIVKGRLEKTRLGEVSRTISSSKYV
jgi:DNA-directed RNA polymerase III subunit RPC1